MDECHTHRPRSGPNRLALIALPVARQAEKGDPRRIGKGFLEQLQLLGSKFGTRVGSQARDVPARSCEARHDPVPYGIDAGRHDDRHLVRHTLRLIGHTANSYDYVDLATDQLRHDLAEPLEPPLRRPTLEGQVLALDITEIAQGVHEGPSEGMDRIRSHHF